MPDKIAERYQLLRPLGAGGMGEAYLADDLLLHRQVVIKRMSAALASNEQDRRRFLSEAKRAAAINHPHVVQIYDVLEVGGELLLVLEYVDGRDLRKSLSGRVSLEQFFPLALQITEGVAAAHSAHIIHCDLKPENILVSKTESVKILDFGLARPTAAQDAVTVSLTQPKFAGTPGYMAPEMILEQPLDERADIFALGVIFYELLTGIAPFRSTSLLETLHKTTNEDPPPLLQANPDVPLELDWIVGKMLAKSPNERYSSVHDIHADLVACQRKVHSGTASSYVAPRKPSRFTPRRKALVFVAVFVSVIAAAAYFYRRNPNRSADAGAAQVAAHYRSVAVVPFRLIGDAQHEFQAYADGMSVILTSKLARIADDHQLQVTPASEVLRRSLTDAASAKQQLGVDLVIEGHLQKVGKAVRITYDLVDTRNMSQLRSDGVDGSIDDPFSLEDQMVDGALNMLNVQLEANERRSLGNRGTTNAAAYDLFLKGSGYLREYGDVENVERAIQSFQGALLEDPHYAQADAALGRAYWMKYQLTHDGALVAQASASCDSAVRKNSTLPDSHLCVGIVDAGRGLYENATRELEIVVEAEPKNDAALHALAGVYEKVGKTAEAEQVYKRGIAAQPHYWGAYEWLGVFYARQARYADAATQFREAINRSPSNASLYTSLAGVLLLQGKNDECITALRKAVDLRPGAGAYQNLGQAYLQQRNFKDAVMAFQQALGYDENNYILEVGLGDAYTWLHQHGAEATDAYRKALKIALEQQQVNSRDQDLNIMLAYIYAALADKTHALEHLNRAQKDNPDNPETLFFAARIYARLGNPDQAAEHLLKALKFGYSNADIVGCPDLDGIRTRSDVQQALARRP